MKEHPISRTKNKRGYSTEGSTLLPSVLRPRLFGGRKKEYFLDLIKQLKMRSNIAKNSQSTNSLFQSVKNNINSKESGRFSRVVPSFSLFAISVTILSIFSLFCSNANASAFSLTLTVPDTVTININPTTNNGFGEGSSSNLKVKTDSPAGYKLQLGSKSNGTNELVNTTSSNSKLTSITANTTSDNFKNSGAANTWGYKPSKLNGSANTNYVKAPSGSTPDTLDTTSAANSTDNTYSLGIAAKVNSSTVAGTYTNTFVLTATANTLSYTINYDLNSGTWSGTTPQTGNTTSETVPLDSHSPTKSGYTFKGWCSSSSITNNNTTSAPSCSGTTYQPSGTYKLTSASNTLNLYAMWQQNVTYRSYTIRYYSNVGSPSNMPSTQTGSAASTSSYKITLRSNTPTLSGYEFKGWCTSSTSSDSCSGTTYQPSASITISSNGQTLNLYAMWKSTGPISCSASNKIPASPNATFGGKKWTTTPAKCDWTNARNACPSGYHLPSKTEFDSLLSSVGTGSQLYDAGWHDSDTSSAYWSSTPDKGSYAYVLLVYSNHAHIANVRNVNYAGPVRCVAD